MIQRTLISLPLHLANIMDISLGLGHKESANFPNISILFWKITHLPLDIV